MKRYDSGQTGVTFRSDSRNVIIEDVQVFTGATADVSQFNNHHTVINAKNGTRFLWAHHLN